MPLKDIESAYLMRAQMLHPDKYAGRPDLRAEAERAMTQLNLAWEALRAAPPEDERAARERLNDEWETEARTYRPPAIGECDLCGSSPARPFTLRQATGMVLFWRQRRFQAELCRSCGISLFRDVQASGLTKGWWGIVAPLANIVDMTLNLAVRQDITRMPPPAFRDPLVISPFPIAMPLRPSVFRRPGPWIATAVASVLALTIISSAVEDQTSTPAPAPASYRGPLGSCLDGVGAETSCSSSTAVWRIAREVQTATDCYTFEEAFSSSSDGRIYCATHN
jgi:hypothetical protein